MNYLSDVFSAINQEYGINLTVFYDKYDAYQFLQGLLTTVELSISCIILSVIIGLLGAMAAMSKARLTRGLVYLYIQAFRNTPPLAQLYFFYFGVGHYFTDISPSGARVPLIGNMQWAILSLALYGSSFNIEIFRSGIEAIPRTTIEAAEALGYSGYQKFRYIILPLSLRSCLPALTNNLVNMVKTTANAYAIAVPELLYASNQIWSNQLNVSEMMNLLLFTYVGLIGFLVYAMNKWERALQMPGVGGSQRNAS